MQLLELKNLLNNNAELVFKALDMHCEIFTDNIYCKCPIHEGSDNPRAFSYSIKKGIWKCWTRDCQAQYSNDILGLIQGALSNKNGMNVDFSEAIKWSKKLLGISRNYTTTAKPVLDDVQEDFNSFVQYLKKNATITEDDGITHNFNVNIPSAYFLERHFDAQTLEHFQVGDCVEKGKMQDRAIIPIHNNDGSKIVGLIGRSTKEYKTPKFLIYPKGFNKSKYLYNYHRAYARAKDTSCLFLTEGQGDVWKLYEAGVYNAVGLFGKTISEQQEKQILSMPITKLIVLTDNDQAGKESKIHIKRQLSRSLKLIFPTFTNKDVGDMSIANVQAIILNNLKGTY